MTIVDQTDRLKVAGDEPTRKDKAALQRWLDCLQGTEAMLADRAYPAMLTLIRMLATSGAQLVYLTGRSEKYRPVTLEWLHKHRFPHAPLLMRENNDWRKPAIYKGEQMFKWLETKSKNEVILVLDDDHSGDCSEMYRKQFGAYHLKALGDR